ncbi:MAG: excinuclease ABC subunit UvrA, partial [Gammaproteobacteria bacterium]|nr:excinuclease ABC subunit UvrA [Gammaproteobacteria bacterium]
RFSFNVKGGRCEACSGDGLIKIEMHFLPDVWVECEHCKGRRFSSETLHAKWHGKSIADVLEMSVAEAAEFFAPVAQVARILDTLVDVGLGYITLGQPAPQLSGGEAQRVKLSRELAKPGTGQTLYILDEPTTGLHFSDIEKLLHVLERLVDAGNTVLVVEHNLDVVKRADHVIDLGPGAGIRGGRIVGEGKVADLMRNPDSITGRFLREPLQHSADPRRPVSVRSEALHIKGARLHNLNDLDVRIPLGRLVVVTGVSGSGKSTLARDVLHASAHVLVGARGKAAAIGCAELRGIDAVDRVLEVDQTPIGKTPRSCPATYVGIWDDIRKIYAGTSEARLRGYGPGRFSFNTAGGRCDACEGQGVQTVEMSFLPDVKVTCDACGGRRFNGETLAVLYRERSIGDVLAMSIEDATEFFAPHAALHHVLKLLCEVGLGYLTLGQQSPTLSGGEAQRIKLVTELSKVRTDLRAPLRTKPKHTLYVLDEPTVGLHMADVEKLLAVLHRLVDAGNTVVVVEHDLDVIAEADWVIDMGPEAGANGGRIVAEGPPATIMKKARSHTGKALRDFLTAR